MPDLTHFDATGRPQMVDVGAKPPTERQATASGRVRLKESTMTRIRDGALAKGDVLQIARLAGIMATKRAADLIPLCHPLPISGVQVEIEPENRTTLRIEATVRVFGRTGVEMEALTAVSVAALTIYDMVKAIDRDVEITQIRLESKSGGASGEFQRADSDTVSP